MCTYHQSTHYEQSKGEDHDFHQHWWIDGREIPQPPPAGDNQNPLQNVIQNLTDVMQLGRHIMQPPLLNHMSEMIQESPVVLQNPLVPRTRGRPVGARNNVLVSMHRHKEDLSAFELAEQGNNSRRCSVCRQIDHSNAPRIHVRKACWESIKAAYTSVSITDGMDLYRDLNKVFYDPSLGVAKLLDQMDLLRRKLAVPLCNISDPIWAINLISECCLEEKGCTIESSKNGRIIYDKYGNVAFIANRHNKLNKLNCKIVIPIKDTITKDKQDQSLAVSSTIKSSKTNRTIYDKYGNVALTANRHNNFNKLNRKMVIPIKGTIIKDKQDQSLAAHRAPFPTPITTTTTTTTTKSYSIFTMDIAEPINVASANHAKQVKLETIIPAKAIAQTMTTKFKSRNSDAFSLQKHLDNSRHHTSTTTGTAERKNQNLMILYALCTRTSHTCAHYEIKTPNNAMHYARIRHRCQGLSPIKPVNKHDNHML
ncbi:hypothetical protein BASA83_003016 [Batrachochytrium salamandrivorans]|nr:hypothetical protein BASA83_003016 [Batrachochytrium salamandrivorans]